MKALQDARKVPKWAKYAIISKETFEPDMFATKVEEDVPGNIYAADRYGNSATYDAEKWRVQRLRGQKTLRGSNRNEPQDKYGRVGITPRGRYEMIKYGRKIGVRM